MQEAHDLFYNKIVHIKLSLLYIIALLCIYLNKSALILLLKTVDSLGIFILLFLSVLYINTGYEEEEYQDCPDL
jgi:amino acid transporter